MLGYVCVSVCGSVFLLCVRESTPPSVCSSIHSGFKAGQSCLRSTRLAVIVLYNNSPRVCSACVWLESIPRFYFLTISHFSSACQDLWAKQDWMEISVRWGNNQTLSHSQHPTLSKTMNWFHQFLRRCVTPAPTCWCDAPLSYSRWGHVPAQAQSGAVVARGG